MTPKEKAKELVDKYMPHIAGADRYNTTLGIWDKSISKNCAIIAVDEILKNGSLINQSELYKANKIKPTPIYKEYWKQVKKEIEKL